jgi:hypothetical protein
MIGIVTPEQSVKIRMSESFLIRRVSVAVMAWFGQCPDGGSHTLLRTHLMTEAMQRPVYAELTEKWRSLAARRRAYFVQLYESGRWRLYYSEEAFITAVREVVAVAQAWDDLACRNAAPPTPQTEHLPTA